MINSGPAAKAAAARKKASSTPSKGNKKSCVRYLPVRIALSLRFHAEPAVAILVSTSISSPSSHDEPSSPASGSRGRKKSESKKKKGSDDDGSFMGMSIPWSLTS